MSTQQLVPQAPSPLVAMLTKYKGQIEDVLPKHLTPTRVLKMIVGAINKNPALLQCTPMSVINAVLTASQLGLEISPGQSYLVPFGKECTLIIDYRGKIDLAQRSGKVLDIDLEVVYSKEKFRLYRDEHGHKRIEHEPVLYKVSANGEHMPVAESDRGVPIGAYAIAVLKEGPPKIVFMPSIDIEAIRQRSRAKNDGPWKTDPMEMWKKTVCHRICKTLPYSAELRQAQEIDDGADEGSPLLRVIESEDMDEVAMISAGVGSESAAVATENKTEVLAEKVARKKVESAPAVYSVPSVAVATPDNPWPKRVSSTFLMALGSDAFNAVLAKHGVALDGVNAQNYKAVWDAMTRVKDNVDAPNTVTSPETAPHVPAEGSLF